ncbi:hypothetical protein FGG08_007516 [Glutinoglossum americanum]|uniref:Uncharacterized protein n=1 Tax=Glutinoglossum americanum TaxID=1670608 RepID=A0A9P8I355_9PEZI|nr:hypothetical protein FGG08_007516 [Glutinoglossum americanum]
MAASAASPAPSTPPSAAVSRVLRLFQLHREGRLDSPWTDEPLQPAEFIELQSRLKEDDSLFRYTEHKLRYDYDPVQGRIAIRRPTAKHDSFLRGVARKFESQLQAIGEDVPKPLCKMIKQICDWGHGDVYLDVEMGDGTLGTSTYSPDAQYCRSDARLPPVILEVSYSQTPKNLASRADVYIVNSDGVIGLVIGFDLDYGKGKEAKVLVWRPEYTDMGDGQVRLTSRQTMAKGFRNESGKSLGGELSLEVRDFLSLEDRVGIAEKHLSRSIEVSFTELTRYLDNAERFHQSRRGGGPGGANGSGVKIQRRLREPTPPQPPSAEREREIREEEEEVRG